MKKIEGITLAEILKKLEENDPEFEKEYNARKFNSWHKWKKTDSVANIKLPDIDAITKNGAKNFEDVSKLTSAGLACGRCRDLIQNIIKEYVKSDKKEVLNPVKKIIKINSIWHQSL